MRIAVATTGGDSPGMNACVRAVVRACAQYNAEVVGVRRGLLGLVRKRTLPEPDYFVLRPDDVSNILNRGGTILGSARESDLRSYIRKSDHLADLAHQTDHQLLDPEAGGARVAHAIVEGLQANCIDGLILIGGDKTSRLALTISRSMGESFPLVVIPASIDNDIHGSEITLGYESSVAVAVDLVDNLRETATSHERVFVVELMGRNHGQIAAAVALATGAEEVLLPENPLQESDLTAIVDRLRLAYQEGRQSAIVAVAEGVRLPESVEATSHGSANTSAGEAVRSFLESSLADLGWEVRLQVLGYLQRGAAPTAGTRNLAARCAVNSVDRMVEMVREGPPIYAELCSMGVSGGLAFRRIDGDMVRVGSQQVSEIQEMAARLSYLGRRV